MYFYRISAVIAVMAIRNCFVDSLRKLHNNFETSWYYVRIAKKRKASGDIYVAKNELAALVSLKKAVRRLSDEVQKKREASKVDVHKKLAKIVQTAVNLLQTYSEMYLSREGYGPVTTPRPTMSDGGHGRVLDAGLVGPPSAGRAGRCGRDGWAKAEVVEPGSSACRMRAQTRTVARPGGQVSAL